MKLHWAWIACIALAGCDSVVVPDGSGSSSSSEGSTSGVGSGPVTTTIPPTTDTSPTTVGPGTSSTTDGTSTTGTDSTGTGSTGSTGTGEAESTGSTGTGEAESTGSSSGSGSTGGDPTTGVSFIVDPTAGPNIECDPYLQDCPDGEKCNPWANDGGSNWNALGCFPVDPTPGLPGEPCQVEQSGVSGVDTCEVGAMCWDVEDETNEGVCIAMCDGSPDMPTCAPAGTSCVISNEGVLNLCLPGCDPLLQDCADGQGCYPVEDTFVCAPDASGENGLEGDLCEYINACDPGLMCLDDDAYGPGCPGGALACCSPFCDVTVPSCTEPGQECLAWFEEGAAPPGFADLGICSVAP